MEGHRRHQGRARAGTRCTSSSAPASRRQGPDLADGVKDLTGKYQKVMAFEKEASHAGSATGLKGQKPQRYMYLHVGRRSTLSPSN